MSSPQKSDVAIVGLGNWGTSLTAALVRARIPPREIIVRRQRKSPLATTSWARASLDARILWLCVPDSAVSEAASQIIRHRRDLSGQIVVHSGGALTVDALDVVRRAGASVASAHPAMTFPTRHAVPLDSVLFGVETADPATRRTLHTLIRKFGGEPFKLSSKHKALYHAAGTLASPLLVSELTAAIETARLAGLDRKTATHWVEVLANATVRNLFEHGPARSFSGPFARGDTATIQLHLQALQKHPILAEVYRSLALHALDTLPVRNAPALTEALRKSAAQKSHHLSQR
ncbi:MAG TPA: Rossmann-like and DUF2520 domain-containing protein [Silvibacterium sp.]|nr:Rossmann-like and DUF2520 domain-containing protein [Silvibacterium sp.]